jgi:hypothetical protein
MTRPIRPSGQPTRGKTALNRLRQIDIFVALVYPDCLSIGTPLVADLGFGAFAWTTLEMRDRWRTINPDLRVLGIEIDPERVAAARPYADPPAIDFQLGGFNLTTLCGTQSVRLIRCYNVLRQYEEEAVPPALHEMGQALEVGGVLIEGTSNPTGRMVVFDVYRQREDGLRHEALVFGTNFSADLAPIDFQTILPKRLIHHAIDPAPNAFFTAWTRAVNRSRGLGLHGRWAWVDTVQRLAQEFPIDRRDRIVRRGYLVLHDPLLAIGL